MPRKPEGGERVGLLRTIFHDPWRKLISIAMAALLWLYLDSQVSSPDEILASLRPISTNTDPSEIGSKELGLRLDLDRYAVISIRDADAPEIELEAVAISVRGPRRQISDLVASPRLLVQPDPITRDGRTYAEFTIADVTTHDPRDQLLLRSMQPSRVSVELTRNVSERVVLDRGMVRVLPPPNVTGFLDRLVWDDMVFSPSVVTVLGPEPLVRSFQNSASPMFEWQPDPPASDASVVRTKLKPVDGASRLKIEPAGIALEIPFRAEGRQITLPGVEVLLRGERARERFQLDTDRVDVQIEAFHSLQTQLDVLNETELREWVAANCDVIARINADAPPEGGSILRPQLVIAERKESDWRVLFPPTINYRPKSP